MVTAVSSQRSNTAFALQKLQDHPLPSELEGRCFYPYEEDLYLEVAYTAPTFFHYYKLSDRAVSLAKELEPFQIVMHAVDDPLAFGTMSQLTVHGLVYLAAYLKRTKDVDIIIVDERDGITDVVKMCVSQGMKRFGVIGVLYSLLDSERIAHVVPFFISVTRAATVQVVDLDSKATRTGYYENLKKDLPEADFFGTAISRQADCGSCITDAMVILPDILTHAKAHNISDLKAFLAPHFCASPGKEPVDYQPFLLPKVWARTAQVKASISPVSEDPVVHSRRDKATGIRHPETLSVFLGRYRVFVHKTASVSLIDRAGAVHPRSIILVDRDLNGFLRCKANSFRRVVERAAVLERTDEAFQRILEEKRRLYRAARPVFDLSF